MPRVRELAEDFEVEEVPLFPLTGEGHHAYLWIEKRLRTTDDVLKDLAELLELPARDIGYAGRKDRRAVTRQWFSVPVRRPDRLAKLEELDGARVLEVTRHSQRLRVGQLQGNHFRLRVRDVSEAQANQARQKLDVLVRRGMPNRYGRQRFGRDGMNARRGAELLRGKRMRGDRRRAWLMVSALQSLVFNRVLERRPVGLDELLPGDLVMVHGSGELLPVKEPASHLERLGRFEVSPTGPIFGAKMRNPAGAVRVLEESVMSELEVPPMERFESPKGIRLFGDRRPLRVRPEHPRCDYVEKVLHLEFALPAGSYATVLLDELFPDGYDEGPVTLDGSIPAVS